MLKGFFVYDSEGADLSKYASMPLEGLRSALNETSLPYAMLQGYDISGTTFLEITIPSRHTHAFETGVLLEGDEADLGTEAVTLYGNWSGIPMTVGQVNAKVGLPAVNASGKRTINKEAFSDLGGIIQGMRSQCSPRHRKDFFELGYDDSSFNPKELQEYLIRPFGEISIKGGEIQSLRFEAEGILLVLEEEEGTYNRPFFSPDNPQLVKLNLDWIPNANQGTPETFEPLGDRFLSLDEIREANPNKNFDWLLERDYRVVKPEEVEDVCRYLMQAKEVLAYDTETTGLRMNFKSLTGEADKIVGLVFSVKEGEAFYFPLRHNRIQNICSETDIPFFMGRYFKPLLERRSVLTHNASFDWKASYTEGITINVTEDTMILYQLSMRNAGEINSVALKTLTKQLLGRDSLELSDFAPHGSWGKDTELTFADLDEESVRLYACADTDNTLALRNYAIKQNIIEAYNISRVYKIEVQFAKAIGYQEFYGHGVLPQEIQVLGKDLEEEIANLYAKMIKLAGGDFNPNSAPQLRNIFFEKLGAPVWRTTGTGQPSTDKAVLKNYSSRSPEEGPYVEMATLLLAYRNANKLYTDLIKNMDKLATPDGFFFSSIRAFLETGRLSVTEPNYQSYSGTVKKYIKPRSGFYMADMDYSAVEYRVLSSIAGQQNLIDAFQDPDTDYHTIQAARMFGVPEESVTSQMRTNAKGINFGVPYGMGLRSLAVYLFGSNSPENDAKAEFLYEKYFEGQDNVRAFFRQAQEAALKLEHSETFFGRRRYFDRRLQRVDAIKRAGANHRIQGTAADIYKYGVGRLFAALESEELLGKVLLTAFVHDETLLEIHKSINPIKVISLLREAAMIDIPGWCPLYIGLGFGRNWYEAKSTEFPVQVQEALVAAGPLPWWDGDIDRLYQWELDEIANYSRARVISFLRDIQNSGDSSNRIPPVISGFVADALSTARGYSESERTRYLGHPYSEDIQTKGTPLELMQEFGRVFGFEELVERSNFLPPEVVSEELDLSQPSVSPDKNNSFSEGIDEDTLYSLLPLQGFVLDLEQKLLYFYYTEEPEFIRTMQRFAEIFSSSPDGALGVVAVDTKGKRVMKTKMRVDPTSLASLRQIWSIHNRVLGGAR